jgi:hypothetical protein
MKDAFRTTIRQTIGIAALFLLCSCSMFPVKSPFLSERSTLEKTQLENLGFVAFIRDNPDIELAVDVDVKNLRSGKKYRLDVDPAFFNFVLIPGLEKKLRRNVISDSVAFYALPEGEYEPVYSTYNVLDNNPSTKNQSGYKSHGQRFKVEKGKITSFGRIRVDFKQVFLKKTTLDIYSTGASILNDIRAVQVTGLSDREITEQEFRSSYK